MIRPENEQNGPLELVLLTHKRERNRGLLHRILGRHASQSFHSLVLILSHCFFCDSRNVGVNNGCLPLTVRWLWGLTVRESVLWRRIEGDGLPNECRHAGRLTQTINGGHTLFSELVSFSADARALRLKPPQSPNDLGLNGPRFHSRPTTASNNIYTSRVAPICSRDHRGMTSAP